MLPEEDEAYLKEKGFAYHETAEAGFTHLVISGFAFPEAYTPRQAELLIRLPAGYPDAKPDMFWTRPDVRLASGAWPLNCATQETYLKLVWQRWSRHWHHGWRPGVDGLRTFIAAIIRELERGR
jgi:hypothetical protein